MQYNLKVTQGFPFSYKIKKSRFYNLDNSRVSYQNHEVFSENLIQYSGLNASFNVSNSLNTINIVGGELPDYTSSENYIKTYCANNKILWDYRNLYINFTVNGSPTYDILSGIVKGFSSSNYLTIGNIDLTTADSWEFVSKFKATTLGKYQFWYHRPIAIGLDNSNRMHVWSLPVNDVVSSFTFLKDIEYFVKFEFTGTEYNGYYKTSEEEEWVRIINVVSSTKVSSTATPTHIGLNSNKTSEYFYGEIDLSKAYIKVNDVIVWSPLRLGYINYGYGGMDSSFVDDGNSHTYNIFYNTTDKYFLSNQNYISGSMWVSELNIPQHTPKENIIQDWVNVGENINYDLISVSDFTNRYDDFNEITLPKNYELLVKFKHTTNDSTTRWIFTDSGSNVSTLECICGIKSNKVGCYTTAWKALGSALTVNTIYWVKVRRINGFKFIYTIQDNNYDINSLPSLNNWSNCIVIDDNKIDIVNPNDVIRVGNHYSSSYISSQYFKGNIFYNTLQINELDTNSGLKRQIYSLFNHLPQNWIVDDSEDYLLNSKNVIGSDGLLTNTKTISGFGNTMNKAIDTKSTVSIERYATHPQSFHIHFKTGEITTGNQHIMYCGTVWDRGPCFCWLGSNDGSYPSKLEFDMTFGGTTYVKLHSSIQLQANTEYWAKVETSSGQFFSQGDPLSLYLSTDGINWTLQEQGNTGLTDRVGNPYTANRTTTLGVSSGTVGSYFHGSIYPDDTYIITDGSYLFRLGTKRTEPLPAPHNFTIIGSLSQGNNIYHGFSDNDYIQMDTNLLVPGYSYEFVFKIDTNITDFQNVLAPDNWFELYVENGYLHAWLESQGGDIVCGPVNKSTKYWAKIETTDNTLTLSYSTDGVVYIGSVSSTCIKGTTQEFNVGHGILNYGDRNWSGSIDMGNSHIYDNNGNIVW